jgi:hypothetical protein
MLAPISQVPAEMVCHVFNCLENPQDLWRVSLVCKSWRQLVDQQFLWEKFFRPSAPSASPLQLYSRWIARWIEHLKSLKVPPLQSVVVLEGSQAKPQLVQTREGICLLYRFLRSASDQGVGWLNLTTNNTLLHQVEGLHRGRLLKVLSLFGTMICPSWGIAVGSASYGRSLFAV